MNGNDKRRVMIFGVALGAFTGLLAAFLLVRRADENDSGVAITTGEGFRLGMLVVGVLRQIAQLSE